jgi:GAF domain-containing protein
MAKKVTQKNTLTDEAELLKKNLAQKEAELAIISSVSEAISKQLNIETITKIIGDKVRDIFKSEVTEILLLDESTNMIHVPYSYYRDYAEADAFPFGEGLTSKIIKSGKPLIHGTFEEALKLGVLVQSEEEKTETYIGVPITVNDKVIGVVSIQSYKQNDYNDEKIRLLSILSTNMGIALQNAKLFNETKRLLTDTEQRTAELTIINSVGEAMSKQLDVLTVTKIVGDKLKDIFSAEVTEILLLDHASSIISIPYSYYNGYQIVEPFKLGTGLTSEVINTRKPLLLLSFDDQIKRGAITDDNLGEADITETYMGVPILFNDKILGVVSIQSYQKNAYNENDVRLLSTLSTNMGVTLQNAKLFEETKRLLIETEQRTAELAIINSVQEGLATKLEMQAIYDLVGDKIRDIFDAQVVDIGLHNSDENLFHFPYTIERGVRFPDEPLEVIGFRKHVLETRQPLLIKNNNSEVSRLYGNPLVIQGEAAKSMLYVPMIVNGEAKGVISLQNLDNENAFDESDVTLLTTLTNAMSVALENARLFDETNRLLKQTEQRTAELAIINSVGEAMSKELDINAVTKIVGDKVREIFHTEVTEILLLDHEREIIEIPYSYYNGYQTFSPFPLGEGLTSKVIRSRKPLLLNNIEDQIKHGAIIQSDEDKTESYMGVPILFSEKVLGVVSIQSYTKNVYDENNLRLLSTLSASMGIALQNAKLFDETNKLLEESKQQAIELAIINSVGEGLAKQLDFQSIVDLVGDKIREVFNAQVVSISTYDEYKDAIHHRYVVEKDERFYFDEPLQIDPDRKEIITTKLPLIFGSSQEIIDHSGEQVLDGEMPESFMGVPIIHNQKATGVITVQDLDRKNLYSEKDGKLLLTLASNMGVALENARLFEETKRLLNETQQRNVELAILNTIQEGLVMEMDFNSIITLVGDKFREALGFQDLGIRIYDRENNILHFPYEYEHGERLEIPSMEPTPLSKYVLETGKMLLLKKATEEEIAKLGITGQTTIPGTDESKSLVFVPIIVGTEAKGLILIENYEKEDAFSESEVRLLTTVANSMSVALENARLFDETNRLLKETEQRTAELSVINSVQEGLAKELDTSGIYNLVGDRLCSLFPDSQTLVIRTFNHDKGLEEWQYAVEKGIRLEVEPRPFNWANRQLIEIKKYLDIKENYIETAQKFGGTGVTKGFPPKSAVFVPIIAGDLVIGSISLQNVDKENAFSDSDVRLVTTVANSMSVALENARLFDQTLKLLDESKKRAEELGTVNSISQAIAGHLEIDKLIHLVGEKVRILFKASIVYLALLDKDKEMIEFPYGYGDDYPPLKLGEGLTSKIILKKEPLLLNKEVDKKTEELGVKRIGIRSASYLGVPIPVGDEIIGVLSVQSTEQENLFNEDDMRLLGTIAAHVGIAINNANSYEELNKTLADLQATQIQLIAQEKLASLGQLTAGIAHEIKNPLNFVNNFSELSVGLLDELKDEFEKVSGNIDSVVLGDMVEIIEALKQNADKINEHGKRADSIVHSMLQHSRGQAGDKQLTDINAMLDEDMNLVYHGMRAQDGTFNITIDREYDNQLSKIDVIPQDISRVFLNILTNGCYESHRKVVELNSEEPAEIRLKTSETDSHVEIRIRDNGNGIPENIRGDLFTPFFTTKPTGKGTGLGLSISYDIIVAEHQGELLFETEVGKYTEFIIKLPKNLKK